MKTPRFTDLHRYPRGWRKAVDTNIAETFERIRRELQANAEEAAKKVAPLKQRKA